MRSLLQIFVLLVAGLTLPAVAVAGSHEGTHQVLNWHQESEPDNSAQESAALAAASFVGRARDQLHRVAIQLRRDYLSSGETAEARSAAAVALTTYEGAVEEARAIARQSPEGRTEQIEIERLESRLDVVRSEARDQDTNQTAVINELATALLDRRTALSRRETQAIADDPRVKQARYGWIDASARLSDMESDLAAKVRSNDQWRAAKAQLELAQNQLASVSN